MKNRKYKFFLFLLLLSVFSQTFSNEEVSADENNSRTEDIKSMKSLPENAPSAENTEKSAPAVQNSEKKRGTVAAFRKKEINNTLWRLTAISDKDLTSGEYSGDKKTIITLYLSSNGGVNGVIGNDGYFGHYRLSGNDISISLFGNSIINEENEIETEYVDIIKKVSKIEISGNTLTLKSDSGNLVFRKVR